MNLTLALSPELEARLRHQAEVAGKPVEQLALEALEEKLNSEVVASEILPPEEWLAVFDDWMSRHTSRNPEVDDRRESIYPDRR